MTPTFLHAAHAGQTSPSHDKAHTTGSHGHSGHKGGHHGHGCDRAAVRVVSLGVAITLAVLAVLIAIVVSVTTTPHSEGPTACPDLKRAIYDLLNTERVVHSRFGFFFSVTRVTEKHVEHKEEHSSTEFETEKVSEHSHTIVERNTEHLFPAFGNAAFIVAAAAANLTSLNRPVNTTFYSSTRASTLLLIPSCCC